MIRVQAADRCRPHCATVSAYQRLLLRPPPPPRFPPPPPDPRSVFGRASFTFSARPSRSRPLSPLMAALPSPSTPISTKAKPLACPVSRSVTIFTRSTVPYESNMERSVASVVPKLRLPTKIFFIVYPSEFAEQRIRHDRTTGG